MVNVGWNYGRKEKCPICLNDDDTQSHLMFCDKLIDCDVTNCDRDSDSNDYDLNTHMRTLETSIRRREVMLEEKKRMEPDHPHTDAGGM